jgi:quercetin dioxygenase-like cupin family protein
MQKMISLKFAAMLLLGIAFASAANAQSLKISHAQDRTAARGPESAYTGVGIAEFMFRNNADSNMTMAEISFEPGSRTVWHNHPAGQYLIITSGVGWVQARGEKKRVVKAGDVVWTPPGVFHWHGATSKQQMKHLAVWEFVNGSGGEVGKHVTDEEYNSPADGE